MKLNSIVHRTSYIVLIAILLSGCGKDDFLAPSVMETTEQKIGEGETVISSPKKNPFKVENMRQAYANIKGNEKSGGSLNIRTTHLHVKFLPQDSVDVLELAHLEVSDNIPFFLYPLDCDVITQVRTITTLTFPLIFLRHNTLLFQLIMTFLPTLIL